MVAVKKKDCDIDMEKDPLRLKVEGDFVYAEGTSLGGDDGIAVAYILALLDSEEIAHPRIEAVRNMTVCPHTAGTARQQDSLLLRIYIQHS